MDYQIENHGSIILVRPLSSACNEWLEENVTTDALYFGPALAVEPRYLEDLIAGMVEAGLTPG